MKHHVRFPEDEPHRDSGWELLTGAAALIVLFITLVYLLPIAVATLSGYPQ